MIKISSLKKKFNKGKKNEVTAIENMTLELGDTGLIAIYGKSGSGKSTLMNMIGGLDKFDSGKINIDGNEYSNVVSDEFRINNIGYIFQNYCLDSNVDVYENVAMGLRTIGITDEEAIFNRSMTALANVDMAEYYKRDVTTLSGGQQQRVAIARAMAKGSKIILADEPTGNLDEYNTNLVMDILKELSKTHLIILVTHEENLVRHYADRVIEIGDGKIISENEGLNGNSSVEDKNIIFLGDMQCKVSESDGVHLEMYGDGDKHCKLKIVNIGGKCYISSDSSNIVMVDKNSEVKLSPMTSSEFMQEEKKHRDIKLRELDYIQPSNKKKVFGFKETFMLGLHKDFSSATKKRSKIFSVVIALLVVTLLFVTGSLGGAIKGYMGVDSPIPRDTLVISMDRLNDTAVDRILKHVYSSEDVDSAYVLSTDSFFDIERRGFESVDNFTLKTTYNYMKSKDKLKNAKFVRGAKSSAHNKVIVTTGLIKNDSSYKYDDKFLDMIMKCDVNFLETEGFIKIEGIVESDENMIYATDEFIANFSLMNRSGFGIAEVYGVNVNDDTVGALSDSFEYRYYVEDGKLDYYDIKNMNVDYFSPLSINATKISERNNNYGFVNYNTYKKNRIAFDELARIGMNRKMTVFTRDTNKVTDEIRDIASGMLDIQDRELEINRKKANYRSEFNINLATTLSIYAMLIVLTALLMYANFTSRVKEVGIYRAIGVSKSNIVFKIFVESLASIVLTAVIALVIIGIPYMVILNLLPASSYMAPFMQWWLYLALFVGVVGGMSLISILPVLSIINKTPREILTKYDI